ncbi:MAG: hypothetical protein FWE46_03345 [Coriobacteriia bacterium]|nr:hypothetical protein [Coriobacteriia bacterium]
MKFLVEKYFDTAYDYLADRTDAENMPAVSKLLNDAMMKYEDGELTSAAASDMVRQLLPLVRDEDRPELEKMFNDNQGVIKKYLK